MRSTIRVALAAALAAAYLTHGSSALAQKKPSGGAGQNGGGRIHFSLVLDMYSMNDDGSGVALFTAYDTHYYGARAEPSRLKHGGQRWFVQSGWPADHVLLLSDAGEALPLPLPEGLEFRGPPRWGIGDALVSFEGVQWDTDPDSPTFGEPLEGGLYAVWLATDAGGNLTGADGPPDLAFERPLVADPVNSDQLRPDLQEHDWGPDGARFVFNAVATERLLIGDVLTGTDAVLFDPGDGWAGSPKWSPADNAIMFNYRQWGAYPEVALLDTRNGKLKTLVRGSPSWTWSPGAWSPTGSHLVVEYRDHYGQDNYFLRMAADGSGKSRITAKSAWSGVVDHIRVTGWRE